MEIEVSAHFQEFADSHLVGPGMQAYLQQGKGILNLKEPQGYSRRLMKLGGRVLIIEYYLPSSSTRSMSFPGTS
jgi:hypothetical protein